MTASEIRNLPTSVRARLLNLAKERGEDFTGLLTKDNVDPFAKRSENPKRADLDRVSA